MKLYLKILILLIFAFFLSCTAENELVQNTSPKTFNYLAFGDSYTVGESVCFACKFPIQLQDSISKNASVNTIFITKIIAQTGWTTSNLKTAIAAQNLDTNYDLVTLLIGVNNQFQGKPFLLYEQEFPELVAIAINKAKGDKNKVIVVSIPDYAFTPFGNGSATISIGILQYNTFAKNYCEQNNITFVNITDITQLGLQQTNLVASDGLHPSKIAYSKFVERILPIVKEKLGL
jgi:lysophospholipase L1-like esterase